MFRFELAPRLSDGLTVNALHPATLMDTKLVRDSIGRTRDSVAAAVLHLATDPILKPAALGAKACVVRWIRLSWGCNRTRRSEMSSDDNKALVRRLYEQAVNGRDKEALAEIMAEDVASATPFPEGKVGLEGFQAAYDEVIGSFPDYRVEVEDQIAEDDKVVTRYTAHGTHEGEFMGIAPTGKRVELTAIDIDRLADGKIVEHWSEAGIAGLLAELGSAPPR